MTYKLSIQPGCTTCGRCGHILPGWPDKFLNIGLLISPRSLDEHGDKIDSVIASCPLDLIELNIVRKP
jgi:hypothetical protein